MHLLIFPLFRYRFAIKNLSRGKKKHKNNLQVAYNIFHKINYINVYTNSCEMHSEILK